MTLIDQQNLQKLSNQQPMVHKQRQPKCQRLLYEAEQDSPGRELKCSQLNAKIDELHC